MAAIDGAIATQVQPALQRQGHEGARHVSVFALAPIPLLMYLGRAVGDIAAGIAYQRHRGTQDWLWKPHDPSDQEIRVTRPTQPQGNRVAIRISGRVHAEEAAGVVPEIEAAHCEIGVASPGLDVIRTRDQLRNFVSLARDLVSEIRERHGSSVVIHVFPAVPNSVAVAFGKCLLPKADPVIEVCDNRRGAGGFQSALTMLAPASAAS